MNYYWFNRHEILPKAKENYSKEKAAAYYKQNKEAIKEMSRGHKKKKTKKKSIKKKKIKNWFNKKGVLKNK